MTKIKTNKRWKPLLNREDVPSKVLRSQFDWQETAHNENGDYSSGFIQHNKHWYHVADFTRTGPELEALGWDGIAPNGYFSGTLIKLSPDGEECMMATYLELSDETAKSA